MPRPIAYQVLLFALVAVHFAFLASHCAPAFSGPDANGYFAQAGLLANTGSVELVPSSPLSYIGMHFLETPAGEFWSRYPAGVAVLTAIPYVLFGPNVAVLLTPLLASLTLVCLFYLARPWIGGGYALLAAALFALHPLANEHALNWGAHTQTGFFLVAGLWALSAWSLKPHWAKAFAAGLLLGAMPTMRYAEVVAGLGVGVFLIWRVWRAPELRWHVAWALGGALLPIGALLAHNYAAFGSLLDTGYALTGEQQAGTGFSVQFFEQKWEGYLQGLMSTGVGLFFALGFAGLVGMLRDAATRAFGTLLLLVIVPITVTYTAYYFGGGGGMGLRFLLPTLPLYLVPALWFVHQAGSAPAVRAGVVALAVVQGLVWGGSTARRVPQIGDNLASTHESVEWLEEHAPEGSVVIADRGLHDTLQYFQRWQLVDASLLSGGRAGRRGMLTRGGIFGRSERERRNRSAETSDIGSAPQRANPRQEGKARKLRERYDTSDSELRQERILEDLSKLAAGRKVFWVGSENQIQSFEDALDEGLVFEKRGEVPAVRGMMGGPGGARGRRGQRSGGRMMGGMAGGPPMGGMAGMGPDAMGPGGMSAGGMGPDGMAPAGMGAPRRAGEAGRDSQQMQPVYELIGLGD